MIIRFTDPEFDLQTLTVRFLRDGKIIVKFGEDQRVHYTVHPGSASGVLDLHRTDERVLRTDPRRHETIMAITKSAIEEELRCLDPLFLMELVHLWRPLRFGWMVRRRLVIGPRFRAQDEVQAVKGISIKAGLPSCDEPLAGWMRPPEIYEEILERPNVAYWLFDGRKPSQPPYAVAFSYIGEYGNVKLRWAKIRDMQRWADKWEPTILEQWRRLEARAVSVTAS